MRYRTWRHGNTDGESSHQRSMLPFPDSTYQLTAWTVSLSSTSIMHQMNMLSFLTSSTNFILASLGFKTSSWLGIHDNPKMKRVEVCVLSIWTSLDFSHVLIQFRMVFQWKISSDSTFHQFSSDILYFLILIVRGDGENERLKCGNVER